MAAMTTGKIRIYLRATIASETELFNSQSYKLPQGSGTFPNIRSTGKNNPSSNESTYSSAVASQSNSRAQVDQNGYNTQTQHTLSGMNAANNSSGHSLMSRMQFQNSVSGMNVAHNSSGNSLQSRMQFQNSVAGMNLAHNSSGNSLPSRNSIGAPINAPTVPLLPIPVSHHAGHHHSSSFSNTQDFPTGNLMSMSSVVSGGASNYNRCCY